MRIPAIKSLLRFHLFVALLLIVCPAQSGEAVRVGILHSSSGTMAISETALRDTMLMLIEQQNARGGVLGRPLEAVVYNPDSNWQLYAQHARQMIELDQVAVIFGCWTSASRKAVLPVVEEQDSLLFYPVQYEGQESSKNIVYVGATPNQQALPAIDYLREHRGIERWILAGTDYVYPRTTNRILAAYLADLGVPKEDVLLHYSPFGYQDWREPVARFRRFAAAGGKTAIVSTLNGDANIGFYRALQAQGVAASELPVLAFSVGEQELSGIDSVGLEGHLAAWNYFMRLDTPANKAFIEGWREYTGLADAVTNDPMEAHLLGFSLWVQAVEAAGTVEAPAVREALLGMQVWSLGGAELTVRDNNHMDKQAIVAEITADGGLSPIWKSPGVISPLPWSPYLATPREEAP